MSDDTFTTTTSQSWLGRLGSAVSGVLFGVLLFLGSFILLAWNEGRAIHRAKTLDIGAKQVITISPDDPLPANDSKLVYFTGAAEADGPVTDKVFGITANALRLRRDVEMYQWKQEEKSTTKQKLGGGEDKTTTYSYSKAWSSSLIDSSKFQQPQGHKNPDSLPIESKTFTAPGIHVGKLDLPASLTDKITNFAPRAVTPEEAEAAAKRHSEDMLATTAGLLYVGADPKAPEIGDLRVTFQAAPAGPVSVIAGQAGSTLEPFEVANLGSIELLQTGTLSSAAMFKQEKEGNAMLTWILRLVGFVMMVAGLLLVTNVLSVAASVIPFLGNIVGTGTGLLAIAVALPLTLVTIALSWLAYRPLIGIPLLLVAVGATVFGLKKIAAARRSSRLSAKPAAT